MKSIILHLLLILLVLLFGNTLFAKDYSISINVKPAGTLSIIIGKKANLVTELTLSGSMNGDDIITIRNMSNIKILNLADANIVIGGAPYDETIGTFCTEANKISDYMFSGTQIESIVLPKNVTSIGESAFQNCFSLASVTIPKSVISIGNNAFMNCKKLSSISIPNNVTEICNSTFRNCTHLTSISIPYGIVSIGDDAFSNCKNLTSVSLPNSLTLLGNGAFSHCESLSTITLPDSISTLKSYTFNYCLDLTSVTLPKNLTYIGINVFFECAKLDEVLCLAKTPPRLSKDAFHHCSRFNIYIPKGSFSAYKSLTSVEFINMIYEAN